MLHVALIGYGLGGAAFHAPLISVTAGLSLSAIVTANPVRAAEAHARHPGATILASPDDLFTGAVAVDLVVISTPNITHGPLAERALRAGIPVVVDKPVTASSADARRLAKLASDQGVALIPFHNRRWDGDFRTVADLVAKDRLGPVTRFESRFERWRPDPTTGSGTAWKEDARPEAAGGILWDLGPHLIDQALVLFGPPSSVYAERSCRRPGVVVDDDVFVALTFPANDRAHGEVHAHLWLSAVAAQLGPRFRILGRDAAYVKWGLDGQEAALRAGQVPESNAWGREAPSSWGHLGIDGDAEHVPTLPGAYQLFYAGVAATLHDGAPPPVDLADAILGLEIIEAAHRSASTLAVIALPV